MLKVALNRKKPTHRQCMLWITLLASAKWAWLCTWFCRQCRNMYQCLHQCMFRHTCSW